MTNRVNANKEGVSLEEIFAKGGEAGALMRSIDWSQTPLGSVEQWPQSLRTTVSIVLSSKFPMEVFWGPEAIQFYNDAYISLIAEKHPAAMGLSGSVSFAEVWDQVSSLLNRVRETSEAIYEENFLFILVRNGFPEETYFTFSYSPIRDEQMNVGGVLDTVTETTERVISTRRLATLHELSERSSESRSVEDACRITAETLAKNQADIPFSLLYLISDDRQSARLMGSTGVETGTPAAALFVDLTLSDSTGWPLADGLETDTIFELKDILTRFENPPKGSWPEPPHTALIFPITASGSGQLIGFFIGGVSSRLMLDDAYRGFLDLIAEHITTAITNISAYEAERKRAETLAELDRAKTTFFNNVSHEFRTPLTLMLGPLKELLDNHNGPLAESQHETLQLVYRNGLRLLKLVNTLLDFARIESDRVEVSFQPVDLAALTIDLASMFRSTMEKAGLKLTIDCPPLPEPVYVDREMWEKIVLNLLSNAFKFTLEGEITIRLLTVGNRVELQVQDTGVGLPEIELPNLFQRFYRVRNTQSRTYEGSGIGLALVQDLVHLHAGEVRVTSELGRGSIFTVSIPRGSEHIPQNRLGINHAAVSSIVGARPYIEEAQRWLPDAALETDELQQVAISETTGFKSITAPVVHKSSSRARIAVVDDNADLREYLSNLLKPYWQVDIYADGQFALNGIQKQRPDLVITDVMMPNLDGFGLLQALRRSPATHDLPIIMLSARAGEESTIEGLQAGADDYLVKPFTARELLARVNAQLEMSQLRRRILETEQHARAAAEAESQRVNDLLNSMSDAFVVLDRDFRYTYLNPKAEDLYARLTGDPRNAFLNTIMWEKFPGSKESSFGEVYQRALREQIHLTEEAYFEPLDTWFEVRVYPVDEGLSIYFQDITLRKKAEKGLQQYAQELKRSNEELEQYAYIASHDLQEPLRMVTSYLQLLERRYRQGLDDDARDFIQFALGGASRMRNLITDLLAYSRVKRNEQVFAPFSSRKALETALGNLQLEIADSGARIIAENLPTITGHENQFIQLFQNFIGNAIKFRGKDTPEIRISASRKSSEWLFEVSDNGIGIKQEHLSRIFVMFQRLHTRDEYEGTGIGLAICKKVVEQHGGQIWAESEFGKGTTFYFSIPIAPNM